MTTEPSGAIYFEALARRGGKEYTGGPVCWDTCEGTCRECHALGGQRTQPMEPPASPEPMETP